MSVMRHISRNLVSMVLSGVALLGFAAAGFAQGGGGPGGGRGGGGPGGNTGFAGSPMGGGNVGFQGGSMSTGTRGGTSSAARSTSNFLNSSFVSPYVTDNYSLGSGGTATTTASATGSSSSSGAVGATNTNQPQAAKFFKSPSFGNPLFSISTSTRGGTATIRGGTGAGSSTSSTENFNAGSVLNPVRTPHYAAVVKFPVAPVSSEALHTELSGLLNRSTSIPSRQGITMAVEGRTVTLRGQVADDDERRHVEAVIRLTPGVREVHNELVVKSP
jgi:hypothetical protein